MHLRKKDLAELGCTLLSQRKPGQIDQSEPRMSERQLSPVDSLITSLQKWLAWVWVKIREAMDNFDIFRIISIIFCFVLHALPWLWIRGPRISMTQKGYEIWVPKYNNPKIPKGYLKDTKGIQRTIDLTALSGKVPSDLPKTEPMGI